MQLAQVAIIFIDEAGCLGVEKAGGGGDGIFGFLNQSLP